MSYMTADGLNPCAAECGRTTYPGESLCDECAALPPCPRCERHTDGVTRYRRVPCRYGGYRAVPVPPCQCTADQLAPYRDA